VTDISFYHLQRQRLEQALPKLLERVLEAGLRAVVLSESPERAKALNQLLWTYDPDSFLPHGTADEGRVEEQPVYLTARHENPNEASVLVLTDGGACDFVGRFERCLDMFDGNDENAVTAARARWKTYRAAGHPLPSWQQNATGGWQRAT